MRAHEVLFWQGENVGLHVNMLYEITLAFIFLASLVLFYLVQDPLVGREAYVISVPPSLCSPVVPVMPDAMFL